MLSFKMQIRNDSCCVTGFSRTGKIRHGERSNLNALTGTEAACMQIQIFLTFKLQWAPLISTERWNILNTEVTDVYCCAPLCQDDKNTCWVPTTTSTVNSIEKFSGNRQHSGNIDTKNFISCFKVFIILLIFCLFAFTKFNLLVFPVFLHTDLHKYTLCCVFP